MFGFGKKKENRHRKEMREEFETITSALRQADESVQVAVGHAINMASSIFHQMHSTPFDFQKLPKSKQIDYLKKLTTMEISLSEEKNDKLSATGFGLFKMWIGTLVENDVDLINKFSSELEYFSKKGDLGK